MISRGTLIAGLLALEVAIVCEAVVAIRGGAPGSGPYHINEGAPHQIFRVGPHPVLSVDIGYADLTVVARTAPEIDVSVRASTAFGIMRANAPITSRADGETVRIATRDGVRWSSGDDRMVTALVPADTQLTVVRAGDIRTVGLRAEASLKSTGQGSITVVDYDAPALHVTSSDGGIVLDRVSAARVDATSENGRIEGSALRLRDGRIDSEDRVTLGLRSGTDSRIVAEATNGRINLSGFSDALTTTSKPSPDSNDGDSTVRTIRVGAGNGHVSIHANDGNITLALEH